MSEYRTTWKHALAEAHSFQRMYALAAEIVGNDLASRDMQRAADRVVRLLGDVIELPIADARILGKARKKFGKLAALLEADGPPAQAPVKMVVADAGMPTTDERRPLDLAS